MGKQRKKKLTVEMGTDELLGLMQTRALQLADALGHSLGHWRSSKEQFGKASKQGICVTCGRVAILQPYGSERIAVAGKGCPALRGEALFDQCVGRGEA